MIAEIDIYRFSHAPHPPVRRGGVAFSMHRTLVVAVATVLMVLTAAGTSHADDDIAQMMQEVTKLSAERATLPEKFKANLALKRSNEQKAAPLIRDRQQINAEGAAIEAQSPAVDAKCHRTVPPEEMAAAQAECDAIMVPLNKKLDELNQRLHRNKEKAAPLLASEETREAGLKELTERDQDLAGQIEALQKQILLAKQNDCVKSCAALDAEAASQCLQGCWDGALSSGSLPSVGAHPIMGTHATENRTPEQAAEDYKQSGAADPGHKTLKPIPVPPPENQ
jgi:hypothetical protein